MKKLIIALLLILSLFAAKSIADNMGMGMDMGMGTGDSGGGDTKHYLLIDGSTNDLYIDGSSNKLRIDGAS